MTDAVVDDARRVSAVEVVLGVIVPLILIGVILYADSVESPKTAYVGVLTALPILAAVFARPVFTALVGVATWIAAYLFGRVASDGTAWAQTVRLIFIAIASLLAVIASTIRVRRDRNLADALVRAAKGERAQVEAATDPLTGLLNRRGIEAAFEGLTAGPLTVVMVDVDRLKAVNDDYGHEAGDDFLRAVASRIAANVARSDVVGRWGGDEFVLILGVHPDAAHMVMERVVQRISSDPVVFDGGSVVPGVSVGLFPLGAGDQLDRAVAAADRAMYESKRSGSNRITLGVAGA